MAKKLIISAGLLLLCGANSHLKAQSNSSSYGAISGTLTNSLNASTPNAASLGAYGEVPIGLSTGQLNLSVPLHELKYHDITLPISLSYNYTGFKPNEHPGWAGLGWSLDAGGVITRIRHGEVDELKIYDYVSNNTTGNYSTEQYGYLTSGNVSLLNAYSGTTYPPSSNNYRALMQTQKIGDVRNTTNLGMGFDTEPDEFVFNFAGFTGKFIHKNSNNLNDWVVETSSGENFNVSVELADASPTSNPALHYTTSYGDYLLRGEILKIILKSQDGYTYEFGGKFRDANDVTNVEINLGLPGAKYGTGNSWEKGNNIYISSWYLAKITSPTGAVVTLNYKAPTELAVPNADISAMVYPSVNLEYYSATNIKSNYNTFTAAVNTVVFLESIVAGSQTIQFTKAPTNYCADNNYTTAYCYEETEIDYPKYFLGGINDPGSTFNNNPMYSFFKAYNITSGNNTSIGGYAGCMYRSSAYSSAVIPPIPPFQTFYNHWYKLKSIVVKEQGTIQKEFDFNYDQLQSYIINPNSVATSSGASKTGRLELASITKIGANATQENFYSFEYMNTLPAGYRPDYGTRAVDHWGYINSSNNTDFFSANSSYSDTMAVATALAATNSSSFASNYASSREPSLGNEVFAGALSDIHYPTGGETKIYYERNKYRKYPYLNTNTNYGAIQLATESADVTAGGIRVFKTETKSPEYSGSDMVKEYIYESSYGSTGNSSGVLNSGKPNYYTVGLSTTCPYDVQPTTANAQPFSTYKSLSSESAFPYVFDGQQLLYSKVIVKDPGEGSYKISEFTNSDLGTGYIDYVDNLADNTSSSYPHINNGYAFTSFFSREAERGLLKSEKYYTNLNALVKQVDYTYNNDANKYNSSVFFMRKNGKTLSTSSGYQYSINSYLSSYYYFQNFLKTKTETDYLGTTSLVNTYQYNYNSHWNLIEQDYSDSRGGYEKEITNYADNYTPPTGSSSSIVNGVQYLLNNGLYALPVESISKKTSSSNATVVTGSKFYEYYSDKPAIHNIYTLDIPEAVSDFSPSSASLSLDSRYTNVFHVEVQPNDVHNPTEIVKDNNKAAVIRDYDQRYITAVVKNADYAEVAFCNFEGNYTGGGTDVNLGNWTLSNTGCITGAEYFTGHKSINLAYNGNSGGATQSAALTIGRKYIFSFWRKSNGGGVSISDGVNTTTSFATGETVNGWTYCETSFTAQSTLAYFGYTGGGNVFIDDVRLYPVSAQMETSTYEPGIGISSHTDSKGIVTFYEYDDFARLIYIKDMNKNIVKKFEYGVHVNQ